MPLPKRRRAPGDPAGPALATSARQHLAGTYTDETVEQLAHEDGRAQLFTGTWGKGNREPHVILAVNRGAAVSGALVPHDLYGSLPAIEGELEDLAAHAPKAEDDVLATITVVGEAEETLRAVDRTCRDGELAKPEHHWRRVAAEILALGLLGFGDLIFTSTAFEVFGLSDKSVGFLPVNELQLASSSTVIAMLLCMRLAGHGVRELGALVEQTSAAAASDEVDHARHRRLRVRTWFTIGAAIVATLGAFAILVGLSEVRALVSHPVRHRRPPVAVPVHPGGHRRFGLRRVAVDGTPL